MFLACFHFYDFLHDLHEINLLYGPVSRYENVYMKNMGLDIVQVKTFY
jgi:hypothetical protein